MKIRKKVRNHIWKFTDKTRKVFLLCCIPKEQFYPSLKNIAEYLSPPNKTPITTVQHHITKLRDRGLINKYNEPTSLGKQLYEKVVGWDKSFDNSLDKNVVKSIRAHNIQIIFEVIRCNKRYDELSSLYEIFTNNHYQGIKSTLCNSTVMFYYPNKLVCSLPDVLAENIETVMVTITELIVSLRSTIKEKLGATLGDYKIAKIRTIHIAKTNSFIAEIFHLNGETYKSDKVEVDSSHNTPEIEAVDPNTAFSDIEKLVKYDKLLKLQQDISEQIKEIESQLAKSRIDYDKLKEGIKN